MLAIIPAPAADREAALDLLFHYLPPPERHTRLANAKRLVRAGYLDVRGILTAYEGRMLRGAVLASPLAGAGGLIWPPQTVAVANQSDIEDELIQAALDWLHRGGARLAHALMAPEEATLAPSLLRNGLSHVTRLQYLRRDLADLPARHPAGERWTLQTYAPALAPVFHETLLRSYEGSLDCPELNTVRTVEEIIAGHKAQGQFDPSRWWLASATGKAAGVLMLTRVFDELGWDLSYVGVLPEWRRRGLGRFLTQLALARAHSAGAGQLTLAVDIRNAPARNLYAQLGFEATSQRDVYLKFLGAG